VTISLSRRASTFFRLSQLLFSTILLWVANLPPQFCVGSTEHEVVVRDRRRLYLSAHQRLFYLHVERESFFLYGAIMGDTICIVLQKFRIPIWITETLVGPSHFANWPKSGKAYKVTRTTAFN
jgi:hypothetical protein